MKYKKNNIDTEVSMEQMKEDFNLEQQKYIEELDQKLCKDCLKKALKQAYYTNNKKQQRKMLTKLIQYLVNELDSTFKKGD